MPAEDLLSPEERDLLSTAKTAEPDDGPAEPAAEPATDPAAEPAADVVTAGADDDIAERPEAPPVFVPQFGTEEVSASKLADLRKQSADLRKRWSNGEIDDEEYNAQAEKLDLERDEAAAANIRAQVRNELAQETLQQSFAFQRGVYLKMIERVDGVPYLSNDMVRSAFDRELAKAGQRALKENPEATAEELFIEADKAVREQFAALGATFGGKKPTTAAAPAAAAAAPAAKGAPRDVPKTLAGLPAAAPIDTGSHAQLAQLATLEGEDYEMAVAKLAPAERRRLLESAG